VRGRENERSSGVLLALLSIISTRNAQRDLAIALVCAREDRPSGVRSRGNQPRG